MATTREQAMAAAADRVREMALQSQADGLADIQKVATLADPLSFSIDGTENVQIGRGKCATKAAPFAAVVKVLSLMLGATAAAAVKTGEDLVAAMQAFDATSVDAAVPPQIDAILDEAGDDFAPGAHLGGELENAVFAWTDASVSIVCV
jgi:hypothetical protein